LVVVCGKGRIHDFERLKQSQGRFAQAIEKYGDAGYQGLARLFAKGFPPIKKRNGRELTADEKAYHRALARVRISIEHVNRRLVVSLSNDVKCFASSKTPIVANIGSLRTPGRSLRRESISDMPGNLSTIHII
jgi:hypothetical protein